MTNRASLLALAVFALLYNPIFNYEELLRRGFTGGAVRAGLSLASFAIIVAILSFHRSSPRDAPSWRSVTAIALILCLGTTRGLLNAADIRGVAVDLFPLLEVFAYSAVLAWVVVDVTVARIALLMLIGWVALVSAIELVLYVRVGDLFATRTLIEGCTLPRLQDFMPLIALPATLVGVVVLRGRLQLFVAVAMAVISAALLTSFFRTLWVAAIAAVLVLLGPFLVQPRRALQLLGTCILASAAAFGFLSLSPLLLAYKPVCTAPTTSTALPTTVPTTVPTTFLTAVPTTVPTTPSTPPVASTLSAPPLSQLVTGRLDPDLISTEPASFGGRLEANLDMLRELLRNPIFGIGFGGHFRQDYRGVTEMAEVASSPNLLLGMIVELGLPLSAVMFFIVGAELVRGAKSAWMSLNKPSGALAWACLAGVAGVIVTLALFPAPLHYALGPYAALLVRIARVLPTK